MQNHNGPAGVRFMLEYLGVDAESPSIKIHQPSEGVSQRVGRVQKPIRKSIPISSMLGTKSVDAN